MGDHEPNPTRSDQRKREQAVQRLQHLAEENQAKMRSLQSQGVAFRPETMLSARIEYVIEMLFPRDSVERIAFEIGWQEKIKQSIEDAEKKSARARLMRP